MTDDLKPATSYEAAKVKVRRLLTAMDHPSTFSRCDDDMPLWIVAGISLTFGDLRQLTGYQRVGSGVDPEFDHAFVGQADGWCLAWRSGSGDRCGQPATHPVHGVRLNERC